MKELFVLRKEYREYQKDCRSQYIMWHSFSNWYVHIRGEALERETEVVLEQIGTEFLMRRGFIPNTYKNNI